MRNPTGWKKNCRRVRLTIDKIRLTHCKAVVEKCKERGCMLSMEDMPGCVILKGELLPERMGLGSDLAVCDCFVFDARNDITVSLVELKSNDLHASQIEKKFENSLSIASRLIQENRSSAHFHLALVLVAKGYSAASKKKLQSIRIRKMRLLLRTCGLKLKSVKEYEQFPYGHD